MFECKECGLKGILPITGSCPEHKTVEQKYYCYGSGMFGCLYDYGPNFCADKEDAISSFVQLFEDCLEPGELITMLFHLRDSGFYKFRNPHESGAQYCQISEETGEMPENDDD